ncbi:MAG: helix-turn-helix domain-containing protein [Sphaerochaeta sp.]
MINKCIGVSKINFKKFTIILFICLIGLFTAEMIYFKNSLKSSIKSNEKVISMTCSLMDNPFTQAEEFSKILLSNPDIVRFINQGPLEEGSSDIQSLIDVKEQLTFSKKMNSVVEEVYIYSKKSDYLISNTNAYMDLSRMYDSLFAFSDLNYLQWKNKYLSSNTKFSFYPVCSVLINGVEKQVIPYIHSYPLDYATEVSGKVILLLKEKYFIDILDSLTLGEKGFAYMATLEEEPIISKGNSEAMDSYLTNIPNKGSQKVKIDGKSYFIVQVISDTFPMKYVFAIDPNIYYSDAFFTLMVIILALIILLAISSIYSTMMILNNKKRWKTIKDAIDETGHEIPYEKMIPYISNIVKEERVSIEQNGGIPFMKETFFRRLIHGDIVSENELQNMGNEFAELIKPETKYEMIRIKINKITNIAESAESLSDIDFTRIVANKQSANKIGPNHYIYMDRNFDIWMICWNTKKENIENFYDGLKQLIPDSLSMAVSLEKEGISNIGEAKEECNEIMQLMINEKIDNSILRYDQLSVRKDNYYFNATLEKQILDNCFRGDLANLENILSLIEKKNFEERKIDYAQLQKLMDLLYHVALKIPSTNYPPHFKNYKEVYNFFVTATESIQSNLNSKDERLIQSIKLFISTRYMDSNLTLSEMAAELDKKENFLYHFMNIKMDCTFAKYLEKYRLTEAARMISDGNNSIVSIAKMCGYSNPQTFRRAFKKFYCMLPSEYKAAK